MINNISNPTLLNKKLEILKKIRMDLNKEEFKHSFSCHYHGINLNFALKNSTLIDSLSSIIPSSWMNTQKNENLIYLTSPLYLGFSFEEWSDETSQDCISFEDNNIAIQRDFAALVSGNTILLICEDRVGDGFYNFLRWHISEKLIEINKFVLHASCVLDKNNKAHLFLGHSGAGKTTITKLSAPRLVLGDDMNLVSISGNQLLVEAGAIGGQFNSMIGYDEKVEVAACYWLKQSDENKKLKLDAISGSQKILASFANLHWPTFACDKIEKLMGFSSSITSNTDFFELSFKNDDSIWKYLDP